MSQLLLLLFLLLFLSTIFESIKVNFFKILDWLLLLTCMICCSLLWVLTNILDRAMRIILSNFLICCCTVILVFLVVVVVLKVILMFGCCQSNRESDGIVVQ